MGESGTTLLMIFIVALMLVIYWRLALVLLGALMIAIFVFMIVAATHAVDGQPVATPLTAMTSAASEQYLKPVDEQDQRRGVPSRSS